MAIAAALGLLVLVEPGWGDEPPRLEECRSLLREQPGEKATAQCFYSVAGKREEGSGPATAILERLAAGPA